MLKILQRQSGPRLEMKTWIVVHHIPNFQRDVERSLQDLVSIPIFILYFKWEKKCVILLTYLQTWLKILIVEKSISNVTFYSYNRILKNNTHEVLHELFTEQMDQEINTLVTTEVKLLLIGSLSSIIIVIIITIISLVIMIAVFILFYFVFCF